MPSLKNISNSEILQVQRCGSQSSYPGPAEWFTGSVQVDPLFSSPEPARASGAYVILNPGHVLGTEKEGARNEHTE